MANVPYGARAKIRPLATVLVGVAMLFGAALAACSDNDAAPLTKPPGADASAPDATDGGSTVPVASAEAKFRALEADLVKTCGGTGGRCHVSGEIANAGKWLAPPDAYKSAKAWRGIVPDDNILEHSIILTQIEHTGPALVNSQPLYTRVREWIAAEINGASLPGSDPFEVHAGFNVVDISKAAPGADGAKLRFTAAVTNDILTMTEIKIAAPAAKGLRLTTPFFVILPAQGPVISDTTNGFVGSLEIVAGETKDLFGGSIVLPQWKATHKLQMVFEKIEATAPPDGGVGGCRSVATFTSSAVPAFKLDLGGGQTCLGCHNGTNDVAKNAMDLSAVDTDNARACAQALNYVNLQDKPKSQIILTPTGDPAGNPNHAVRNAPDTYTQGILGWINNE